MKPLGLYAHGCTVLEKKENESEYIENNSILVKSLNEEQNQIIEDKKGLDNEYSGQICVEGNSSQQKII